MGQISQATGQFTPGEQAFSGDDVGDEVAVQVEVIEEGGEHCGFVLKTMTKDA
jgi:hypothetical protein